MLNGTVQEPGRCDVHLMCAADRHDSPPLIRAARSARARQDSRDDLALAGWTHGPPMSSSSPQVCPHVDPVASTPDGSGGSVLVSAARARPPGRKATVVSDARCRGHGSGIECLMESMDLRRPSPAPRVSCLGGRTGWSSCSTDAGRRQLRDQQFVAAHIPNLFLLPVRSRPTPPQHPICCSPARLARGPRGREPEVRCPS